MPPTNYDELKQAITARFPAMSKQLQAIARFALERPHELALGTVAAIAGAAGVQPSAMMRFAQRARLRRLLRDAAASSAGAWSSARSATASASSSCRRARNGGPAGAAGVLHEFVTDAIAELGHLEESVNGCADLDAAVPAPRRRAADPRARAAALVPGGLLPRLRAQPARAARRTCSTASAGCSAKSRAASPAREGLLIAVSFRNYTPERDRGGAGVPRRGVPVIAITDSPLSPLARNARCAFELGRRLEPPVPRRWSRRCASRRRSSSALGTTWPGRSSIAAPRRRAGRRVTAGAAST